MPASTEDISPQAELRRLLRVHALTVKQLGVDFLPISDRFERGAAPASIQVQATTRASAAIAQPVPPAPPRTQPAPLPTVPSDEDADDESPGGAATLYQPSIAEQSAAFARDDTRVPAGRPGKVPATPKPATSVPTPRVSGGAVPSSAANMRAPAGQSFVPTAAASGALFGASPSPGVAAADLKPLPKLSGEQASAWLERLRARYETDAPHRAFVTDHHNIVFGEGDPLARLMFVGEAPGAEEDKAGRPFVGRSGQLLDKMITAIGLDRQRVYIANVLKTRPPDNATPTFEEAAACAPYLFEQIAIIRPDAIVTLGLPATRLLLNTREPMSNLRGRWATFTIPTNLPHPETRPDVPVPAVPVMPTFHPAFLLRAYTKENRQKVWSDLLQATDRLGMPRPKAGVQ